jgi:hypothetical protein
MVLKHIFQRTLTNNIYNSWLQFKAWYRYIVPGQSSIKVMPPSEYNLVFEDRFNGDRIDSSEWRFGQPWGNFHTEQLWWYWPETDSCAKTSEDGLKLSLCLNPRVFVKNQLPEWKRSKKLPEVWTGSWCAGLISTKKAYQFGWFEAEIMIPTDFMQWSAFWLAGQDSWPPEIDIFEAYTTDDLNDIKIKPNIHWGNAGTWRNGKKDYGAPRIYVKNPHERFVHYACHWTEDFIRIYYDGHLVQECTNEEMLIQNSKPQYIILNHGLKKPKETNPIGSDMIVRNLKVYQNASK